MKPAKRANIYEAQSWFEVLQTTKRSQTSQTAGMTLAAGQSSGDEPEAHEASDQVLLVVEGLLSAVIGRKRSRLKAGDVIIVPPGVKYRFTNRSDKPAITFSVYTPPEYPPQPKG